MLNIFILKNIKMVEIVLGFEYLICMYVHWQ